MMEGRSSNIISTHFHLTSLIAFLFISWSAACFVVCLGLILDSPNAKFADEGYLLMSMVTCDPFEDHELELESKCQVPFLLRFFSNFAEATIGTVPRHLDKIPFRVGNPPPLGGFWVTPSDFFKQYIDRKVSSRAFRIRFCIPKIRFLSFFIQPQSYAVMWFFLKNGQKVNFALMKSYDSAS